MRKPSGQGGGGAIQKLNLRIASIFLLLSAVYFLMMPETGHAQVWVSSGFKSGSDAKHMQAYCSTSAIDPTSGQTSPAATDYPWFFASCSVTSSTGTTFTNSSPSCANAWGWISTTYIGGQYDLSGSANPTALCSIDFPIQSGFEYTINSIHWIYLSIYDNMQDEYICNTSYANLICDVYSDPEGFMALPLKYGPSFPTTGSSIVQKLTGNMTGTGANQIFPDVELEFNVPWPQCCFGGLWQIASTSAQYPGCPKPTVTQILPRIWFAGESYPITITGTGFVTAANASASCPVTPVSLITASGISASLSNVTVVSPTQITATVTPAASDPTSIVAILTGKLPNAQPYKTQILGNQIQWTQNGTTSTISTIDGSTPPTQNAVVGQQIALTTITQIATSYGGSLDFTTWTLPSTPANIGSRVFGIPDYLGNPSSASATPTILTNPGLTTYWLYPNPSIPVTFKYCVKIQGANPLLQCSLPANAIFNVTGPTATIVPSLSLSSTPPATGVWWVSGTDSGCNGWQYMSFGTVVVPTANCALEPSEYGIAFEANQAPDSGKFEWVQIITSDILTGSSPNGVNPKYRDTGLDQFYPYITVDTSWTSVADAPTISLNTAALTNETRTFSATMYLLWTGNANDFKGQDPNYIDVPIGYVTWSISGTADNNTTATPPWSLDTNQGSTTATFAKSTDDGTATHGLPVWSTVAYPSAP